MLRGIMTLTEIKEEIPKFTLAEQMELAEMLHALSLHSKLVRDGISTTD